MHLCEVSVITPVARMTANDDNIMIAQAHQHKCQNEPKIQVTQ